jgi:hypothetical protein
MWLTQAYAAGRNISRRTAVGASFGRGRLYPDSLPWTRWRGGGGNLVEGAAFRVVQGLWRPRLRGGDDCGVGTYALKPARIARLAFGHHPAA